MLSDDMVLLMRAGKPVPWEPAIFAVHAVAMDFGMERAAHPVRRTRERNPLTAVRYTAHGQAFGLQPGGHLCDIPLAEAETIGVLFRREPTGRRPLRSLSWTNCPCGAPRFLTSQIERP